MSENGEKTGNEKSQLTKEEMDKELNSLVGILVNRWDWDVTSMMTYGGARKLPPMLVAETCFMSVAELTVLILSKYSPEVQPLRMDAFFDTVRKGMNAMAAQQKILQLKK